MANSFVSGEFSFTRDNSLARDVLIAWKQDDPDKDEEDLDDGEVQKSLS